MFLPSINPDMKRKRELVTEKAFIVAYPEGIDAVEQRLNNLSNDNHALMDSISASVKNKFATYREESEEQRKRMFPHKDSPFKK
jgi:hypothetical protein